MYAVMPNYSICNTHKTERLNPCWNALRALGRNFCSCFKLWRRPLWARGGSWRFQWAPPFNPQPLGLLRLGFTHDIAVSYVTLPRYNQHCPAVLTDPAMLGGHRPTRIQWLECGLCGCPKCRGQSRSSRLGNVRLGMLFNAFRINLD